MKSSRLALTAAIAAVSLLLMTVPALAAAGPPVYSSNQAGYQLTEPATTHIKSAEATFTVPASTTGLGLVGFYLVDLTNGVQAACGELVGVIGCFDEANSNGLQTLIPASFVHPGDKVTVSLAYSPANGDMTEHASDLTSGHSNTFIEPGSIDNEPWNEVVAGVSIDNATIPVPASPLTLSSFTGVRMTTVSGRNLTLATGQPDVDTADGTAAGAVVAGPSALSKGTAFTVIEQPTA